MDIKLSENFGSNDELDKLVEDFLDFCQQVDEKHHFVDFDELKNFLGKSNKNIYFSLIDHYKVDEIIPINLSCSVCERNYIYPFSIFINCSCTPIWYDEKTNIINGYDVCYDCFESDNFKRNHRNHRMRIDTMRNIFVDKYLELDIDIRLKNSS